MGGACNLNVQEGKGTMDRTFGTIRSQMHRVFGDSPIPRYAQLADLLRQRIARGLWRTGERCRSLEELMREFDVARVTVRQAVDLLAREGLLSAQQGRGTFVTAAPARAAGSAPQTTLGELAEVYRDDQPELLTRRGGGRAGAGARATASRPRATTSCAACIRATASPTA